LDITRKEGYLYLGIMAGKTSCGMFRQTSVNVDQNLPEGREETAGKESEMAFLVDRAKGGDRSSFERLVRMFEGEIFRMVFYRTGSTMDAEDLMQDIFVKVFKNLPKLKEINSFKPWLFSIAVNRVRDYHRKKRILVFLGDKSDGIGGETAIHEIHENPQAYRQIIRREFWEHVGRFVKKLGRREQEVFLLRFLDQLSIKEITQILNKSESTVKTHLYRALHRFKESPELARLLQGEMS